MILLALDTSGISGSAAILEDQDVLSETSWRAQASHSSELPQRVQKICREADLSIDQVEAFAVTIGPGSFTGLRVGLAFVKGLAFSRQKPVAGVSSLQALAVSADRDGAICPLLDARRDEIYGALFERKKEVLIPLLNGRAQDPQSFLKEVKGVLEKISKPIVFLGSGAHRYHEQIREIIGFNQLILDEKFDSILPSAVGRLGFRLIQQGLFSKGGVDLMPDYLRASEAEIREKR
jgi:tRNA threonylcarbamoyladenosine biosynthesis protein TsaB